MDVLSMLDGLKQSSPAILFRVISCSWTKVHNRHSQPWTWICHANLDTCYASSWAGSICLHQALFPRPKVPKWWGTKVASYYTHHDSFKKTPAEATCSICPGAASKCKPDAVSDITCHTPLFYCWIPKCSDRNANMYFRIADDCSLTFW